VLRHWKVGRRAASRKAFMAGALRMLLEKVVLLDIRSLDYRHDVVAKVLAL
jgi:hypothetical protein